MSSTALAFASGSALSAAAREDARHAITANTRRAYQGALARLDSWLAGRPLDDANLAAYVRDLHAAGRSPNTASAALAAVGFVARLAAQAHPAGPETRLAIARMRREGRDRGRGQVAGVRWEQADAIAAVAANGGGSAAGLRDAAIVALMSDAMLRVSECAALDVRDLAIEPADGSGRLTIRMSKTDQAGEGAVQFVGPPTVTRVRAWMDAAGIEDGPLFRSVRRGGHPTDERISDRSVRKIITKRAADAGVENGRVSGHSLRVGAAQSLAAAGAGIVEMQVAGRWKSERQPGRYARNQLAGRGAVARLRYGTGASE